MSTNQIKFNLNEVLAEIGTTRNKVAVESKTRPATILDLASGDTRTIKLETMVEILNAINRIAKENGSTRQFGIEALIDYIPQDNEESG
ncbi:XRE family transcriptional regulator [Paenibacillus sp. ClWae2A]|uniref:XRE family transcriptional regulator n=1 Tax=Paenibacillus sp. ClWae2A TaxID=3057177 RepID=UPI0028F559C1|nr:XRE family transcriptional regulator [Paenibacillus sp. ClWae2A]MDT9720788.1 XRE family transcriptional regulator [Paenibacillus sp. ClWae2A]